MQNKQGLLNLVDRAERGVLLPGEAQILRDAIELLDEMAMTMDTFARMGNTNTHPHTDYDPCSTQTFAVINEGDEKYCP